MKKYALIIIDIAYTKLDRPFTYRIPQGMRDRVVPGSIVTVPFGRANTLRKGYVIGLSDRSELPDAQIKEIAELQAADRSGASSSRRPSANTLFSRKRIPGSVSSAAAGQTASVTGRR